MRCINPWSIFPINLDPPVIRSLSLQFILQALLEGFSHLPELQKSIPLQLKGIDFKKELLSIAKELENIFLFSLENPLSQKESVVDKLCFYFEILRQHSQSSDEELSLLLEEMRTRTVHMKSKMRVVWKKPNRYSVEEMLEQ